MINIVAGVVAVMTLVASGLAGLILAAPHAAAVTATIAYIVWLAMRR